MSDSVDHNFLTIGQAAQYIGVSPQTLRRWDEEGKLRPVRHPASSYRYYKRADLEPFRLDYKRAEAEADLPRHLFQAVPQMLKKMRGFGNRSARLIAQSASISPKARSTLFFKSQSAAARQVLWQRFRLALLKAESWS